MQGREQKRDQRRNYTILVITPKTPTHLKLPSSPALSYSTLPYSYPTLPYPTFLPYSTLPYPTFLPYSTLVPYPTFQP